VVWALVWAWEGVVGGKAGDGWDSGTHMGFRKLGARGLAVLSGAAPLRVGPADLDQGPIKVELKLERAFLTRSRPDPGQGGHIINLRCTVSTVVVLYCTVLYCTVRSVSGKGKWRAQRRA
jgi:hypothetical protein